MTRRTMDMILEESLFRPICNTTSGNFGSLIHGELQAVSDTEAEWWWHFIWRRTSIFTLIEALKLKGIV